MNNKIQSEFPGSYILNMGYNIHINQYRQKNIILVLSDDHNNYRFNYSYTSVTYYYSIACKNLKINVIVDNGDDNL